MAETTGENSAVLLAESLLTHTIYIYAHTNTYINTYIHIYIYIYIYIDR